MRSPREIGQTCSALQLAEVAMFDSCSKTWNTFFILVLPESGSWNVDNSLL